MKIKVFVGILGVFGAISAHSASFHDFAEAIAQIESRNNPKAIGDNGRAIGNLQIQLKCFQDAAKFDKELAKYQYSHCFDPRVSKRVLWAYCSKYEPRALQNGDWVTLAKLWNSGCGWKSKTGAAKTRAIIYSEKLKKELSAKRGK